MTTEDGVPPGSGPRRDTERPPPDAAPAERTTAAAQPDSPGNPVPPARSGDLGEAEATEQQPAADRPGEQASSGREARGPALRIRRPGRTKSRRSFLRELPGIVVTALVISVLIKTFLVQAFYIPSGSMENTLLVNDRVLVNKLADKPDEIHRGDIVVFRDPGGWLAGPAEQTDSGGVGGVLRDALVFVGLAPAAGEEDLIKRVIGVGGDRVVGDEDGHVSVNGVRLREPYVFPGDKSTSGKFNVVVPEGKLWVMGDHRAVSEDSRAHDKQAGTSGFVPVDDVIGRAFTIVWPLDRAQLLDRPDTFDAPGLDRSAH